MEKMWDDLREIEKKLTPEDREPGFYLLVRAAVDLDTRIRIIEGKPPK
jgi:hypothetical protein